MAFVIDDIIIGILDIAKKFIPDPAQQQQLALELAQLKAAQETAELQADTAVAVEQNKVNEIQAASSDKFTSRMRPCAGYGCMAIILYAGIFQPLLLFVAKCFDSPMVLPSVDSYTAASLLMFLCGCRSYDKKQGTATSWVAQGSQ